MEHVEGGRLLLKNRLRAIEGLARTRQKATWKLKTFGHSTCSKKESTSFRSQSMSLVRMVPNPLYHTNSNCYVYTHNGLELDISREHKTGRHWWGQRETGNVGQVLPASFV